MLSTLSSGSALRTVRLVTAVASVVAVLSGCGESKKDKPASQTAAKVNKEEITVHQINYVLQQQRGLPAAQAASASQQALERLIDQELALQKAQEQKLDREPAVVQQLEANRREIIARAYVEKIGGGAPKPSAAEIKTYFDAHPALFSERRIYTLQELNIEAMPEQIADLRKKLESAKNIQEFVDFLKSGEFKFAANQAVRAAEQLPLTNLDRFASMKEGQAAFSSTPTGATVLILVGSRSQPVNEAQATPAIEQFLLNERKRKVVEDDLRALRSASKIQYVGDYAKGGVREVAPPAAQLETPPLTSIAPPQPTEPAVRAASQVEVELPMSASAVMPSSPVLEQGMKGFK